MPDKTCAHCGAETLFPGGRTSHFGEIALEEAMFRAEQLGLKANPFLHMVPRPREYKEWLNTQKSERED